MEEYKFRAIHKHDKAKIMFYLKWVEEKNDMYFVAESDPECMYNMGHVFHDKDWIVEPGIDKVDMHGEDIFKGDIIKYIKYTCTVKYKNGHYYLDTQKGIFWFSDMPTSSMLEIIGTIHDKK